MISRPLNILVCFVVALATLVSTGRAAPARQATTYYVSPTGHDNMPGSEKLPFQTLQRAANVVAPGDTVIVHKGIYAGFIIGWDKPQGGEKDAPITFAAEPGVLITSRNKQTTDAIDLETGSHYLILKGFTISNKTSTIKRAGIRVAGSNHVQILQNTCLDNGKWGIFTSHSDDLLIQNNIAARSQQEHGIYVSNSAQRPIIRANTLYDNANCGIHLNGDKSEGGSGVVLNALVEGNVVFNNGVKGGAAINCDGVCDSIIRSNLLYNNHAAGITLFHEDGAKGSQNNVIAHNTIVMASGARYAININRGSTGNLIFNNILLNPASQNGIITLDGDSRDGFVSDYNIVQDRFSTTGDDSVNLADWRSATGNDTHSKQASPADLFVNVAKNNYRITPDSAAFHAGTTTIAADRLPKFDADGKPFAEPRDAGAYQSTPLTSANTGQK